MADAPPFFIAIHGTGRDSASSRRGFFQVIAGDGAFLGQVGREDVDGIVLFFGGLVGHFAAGVVAAVGDYVNRVFSVWRRDTVDATGG